MVGRFVVFILEGKDRNFGTTKLGLLRFCGFFHPELKWEAIVPQKKKSFFVKEAVDAQNHFKRHVFGYQISIECMTALKTNMQSVVLRIDHLSVNM